MPVSPRKADAHTFACETYSSLNSHDMLNHGKWLFLCAAVLILHACDKDGDAVLPEAEFTLTIENIIPATDHLHSGTTGFLAPGESESFSFDAGRGTYLSFATMFVQSNDLFYAFGPDGLALYDASGTARTGDVTADVDLWDAGTEVNEEPGTGPNQAPRQSGPDTGVDENGNVVLVADSGDGFAYPEDEEVIRVSLAHNGGTTFTVTIDNISNSGSFATPLAPGVWAVHGEATSLFNSGEPAPAGLEGLAEDGTNQMLFDILAASTGYTSPLAPGVWVVHSSTITPLFDNGDTDRGLGLEALAEDGDPGPLATSIDGLAGTTSSGIFNTPAGSSSPGPAPPGGSYSVTFTARDGDALSFATMLVHTNDLFFSPGENGIPLFSNGVARTGDITSMVMLWDAGTEVNEYPGAGNNQPARGGPDTGDDENGAVRVVDDNFSYPAVSQMVRISLSIR